jgi:hypothetical protein
MLVGLIAVGRTLTSLRTRRRISVLLLGSLLPMLTFMGHWPTAIPIPGTDQYLSIPLAGHEEHQDGHEDGHSHAQHCHGNSASCSDVPAFAGVSFALMSEALTFGAAAAFLVAVALHWWRPRQPNTLLPELQPPRPAFA